MRLRHLLLPVLLILALSAAVGPPVCAEEGEDALPPGMTADRVKSLRSKLRKRSAAWWRYRKKLAQRCPQCKGVGKVRWRKGRRITLVDCPKCDGFKMHVDKDVYRRLFYDMRSPAYRMQEGIRARLTAEFVRAKEGQPFPVVIKRYAVKRIEIVDATHGLVWVEKNKDSVARPQEWVWSEEVGKSDTWFLYDEQADGAWAVPEAPTREPEPEPEPPTPTPVPEPPVESPAPPQPAPTPPPRSDTHDREGPEESRKLIKRWGEERGDLHARVIRIELGLEDVEGHEKKVTDARSFLAEIEGWLVEARPVFEEARKEFEEEGLGVRMDHRIKVNTLHFRAFRRLELTEKMLIAVIPDLTD